MARILYDSAVQLLCHFLPISIGNNIPIKRHSQLCLSTRCIKTGLFVQITVVDRFFYPIGKRFVINRIIDITEEFSSFRHNRYIGIIINRSSQSHIAFTSHRDPIAKSPIGQVIFGDRLDISYIFLRRRIHTPHESLITIKTVNFPRDNDRRACPIHAVRPIESPYRSRYDTRINTIFTLLVYKIEQPLLINRNRIEIIQRRLYGNVCIARPTIFLPLRTIRRITEQIIQIGIIGGRPYFVQQIGRRTKPSYLRHIAVHLQCYDTIFIECYRFGRSHLYILETLIIELRSKSSLPVPQYDDIRLKRVTVVDRTIMVIDIR